MVDPAHPTFLWRWNGGVLAGWKGEIKVSRLESRSQFFISHFALSQSPEPRLPQDGAVSRRPADKLPP